VSNKFLVIQTSFLGDVILATAIPEKLHQQYPSARIDMLVRKGNEKLFTEHPYINEVIAWDKQKNKLANLILTAARVRKNKYDYIINLHRYSSSGIITLLSGATFKSGFHNNPFSFCYTHKFRHEFAGGLHETDRNQQLISFLTGTEAAKPALYPTAEDVNSITKYSTQDYITIAPGSVWFTKRLPQDKWIELIDKSELKVYIIGSPSEEDLGNRILKASANKKIENLCGKLSLLEMAALMQRARMNYVNDSAPLHIASAMNAPCTAFFLSTVPEFGFAPLSDRSATVQTKINLDCKPCGVHGYQACPRGHFKCATTIEITDAC
jgi:ADP-heptose:LPS heptosyltransferase